jgi:hypothetical protein
VDLAVVVNESQILTLFCRERWWNRRIELWRRIYADSEGILAKTVEDADLENVNVSADHRENGLLGSGVEVSPQLLAIGAGTRVVRNPNALCRPGSRKPIPGGLCTPPKSIDCRETARGRITLLAALPVCPCALNPHGRYCKATIRQEVFENARLALFMVNLWISAVQSGAPKQGGSTGSWRNRNARYRRGREKD